MKKTYLNMLGSLLIIILLVAGCKKELKETNPETDLQTAEAKRNHKNECQLVSDASEFGTDTYKYNHRGLVDEWNISAYDGYYKMEYNARGRLIKSRFYSGGVLVNTIKFFYRDDRVVKEIWYNGDTEEKTDEVFYQYNRKGKMLKMQSFMVDYYTLYDYTSDGNVSGWNFYFGGSLLYTAQNTFFHHRKNPYLAIPGLDYGFAYLNGAIFQNKWYPTSEKLITYDEEGNPQVVYDQDPRRTIVQANRRNYVTASDHFDVITQEYFHFRFGYENCGRDDGDKVQPVQKLSPIGNSKINPMKFLKKGSAKSIKEQVNELRKQMKDNQSRRK